MPYTVTGFNLMSHHDKQINDYCILDWRIQIEIKQLHICYLTPTMLFEIKHEQYRISRTGFIFCRVSANYWWCNKMLCISIIVITQKRGERERENVIYKCLWNRSVKTHKTNFINNFKDKTNRSQKLRIYKTVRDIELYMSIMYCFN